MIDLILMQRRSESIEELKERLSVLENSVSRLVENGHTPRTSSDARQSPSLPGDVARSCGAIKRSRSVNFNNLQLGTSPSDSTYSTPLFSVSEAKIAIENEIASTPNLSEKGRAVFNAAIASLKQGLDASESESKLVYGSMEAIPDLVHSPALPSPELVHWILQRKQYFQYILKRKG